MAIEFSPREQAARIEFAALYRLAVKFGWTDVTSTHISARIGDKAIQALHQWGSPENGPQGEIQWPALMRMLDREQPDYRN